MHPYRDPLDHSRVYSTSRIKTMEHTDLRTKPEDFIRPRDQTAQRHTGYGSGHVRSVLELDTFGPLHSGEVERKRESGQLPASPNMDRNRLLRADVCSQNSSRKSKRSGDKRAGTTRLLSTTMAHSVPVGTITYKGQAVYFEDRVLADAHARGTNWFQSYRESVKVLHYHDHDHELRYAYHHHHHHHCHVRHHHDDQQDQLESRASRRREKERLREQQRIAAECIETIEEFENSANDLCANPMTRCSSMSEY